MPKFKPAPSANNRHNDKAWQRYYQIIVKYIATYPATYTITPTDLSPETVASRIRDAVRGQLTFEWEPSDISRDRLLSIWEDTAVNVDGANVTLTSRAQSTSPAITTTDETILFTISNPTKQELIAIALLANNQRLSNKKVHIERVPTDLIPFMVGDEIDKAFPNVIVEAVNQTTYRIL